MSSVFGPKCLIVFTLQGVKACSWLRLYHIKRYSKYYLMILNTNLGFLSLTAN